MRFLLPLLLLPAPAFALDLAGDSFDCKLTRQCTIDKGCVAAAYEARLRSDGDGAVSLDVKDSEESFTETGTAEHLGDWNAYTFDDLPSFRSILVINKDGKASLTALGSFFDELVSLQYFGTCEAAE
jgi:hypothetical protein